MVEQALICRTNLIAQKHLMLAMPIATYMPHILYWQHFIPPNDNIGLLSNRPADVNLSAEFH